jgi:hypothetical protein
MSSLARNLANPTNQTETNPDAGWIELIPGLNPADWDSDDNSSSDFDSDSDEGYYHLDEDEDNNSLSAFDSDSEDELALPVQSRGKQVQSQPDNGTRLASTHQTDADIPPNELAAELDRAGSENPAEAGKAAPKPLGGYQQV